MVVLASSGGALSVTGQTLSSGAVGAGADYWSGSGWGGGGFDQQLAAQCYSELYRCNPWAMIPVNKLAGLMAQNPHLVHRKMPDGSRTIDERMPFVQLMRRPSPMMDPQSLLEWVYSTYFIQGEAVLYKLRDRRTGKPVGLSPIHPTRLRYGQSAGGSEFDSGLLTIDERSTGNRWWFCSDTGEEVMLLRRDLVIWRAFNPHSLQRGMSRFEALRSELERRKLSDKAAESILKQGGKPSFVLTHPKRFRRGSETSRQLADAFKRKHGGVENWGKPLVLQEGMTAMPLPLDESFQYLEMDKRDQETIASVFDLPQPAVGLLERSTFSNVTELMRMLGRTTLPPWIVAFESVIDFELRDGRFDRTDLEPEFGEDFRFSLDMEGFLRASPEEAIAADAQAIQTGQKTPAESRADRNREFIAGTDQAFINGALMPITMAGESGSGVQFTAAARLGDSVRDVMGHLSRQDSPADVDVAAVTAGLAAGEADAVAAVIAGAVESGADMDGLRAAVKELT